MEDDRLSFRALYFEMRDYTGHRLYEAVVRPWMPHALLGMECRQRYRSLNATSLGSKAGDDDPLWTDLWEWYALSRVNDYFLVSYQNREDFYQESSAQRETWRVWMAHTGASHLVHGAVYTLSPQQYLDFFGQLGFAPFTQRPYSPFYHEIVEVIEDTNLSCPILVDHVFWPGLMFGEMLFSRAGIRVRCQPGILIKRIAENSRLHFTYWRTRRETTDCSHGWGHNSQWLTQFRRDYLSDRQFHYNVDGEHPLGTGYAASFTTDSWERLDELTTAERVELLVNRCFVRCDKDDTDRWPYDDRYSEPIPLGERS